jgi:hypothetical protein
VRALHPAVVSDAYTAGTTSNTSADVLGLLQLQPPHRRQREHHSPS